MKQEIGGGNSWEGGRMAGESKTKRENKACTRNGRLSKRIIQDAKIRRK